MSGATTRRQDAAEALQHRTDCHEAPSGRGGVGPRPADATGLQEARRQRAELRDELLDREIFYTLSEAKILLERWRREYNTVRPHSALGYRPPAPEAVRPVPIGGLIMSPALS